LAAGVPLSETEKVAGTKPRPNRGVTIVQKFILPAVLAAALALAFVPSHAQAGGISISIGPGGYYNPGYAYYPPTYYAPSYYSPSYYSPSYYVAPSYYPYSNAPYYNRGYGDEWREHERHEYYEHHEHHDEGGREHHR
jgi:hypothetical protein